MKQDVRKFSAYASTVAASHPKQDPIHERLAKANVQLELGLRSQEASSQRSAVLDIDVDELAEAVESFLQRRRLAGLSDGEEALHAMSDELAERASTLYFNDLDMTRIQADPVLFSVFKRLGERGVLVLCPPPFVPERRTVRSFLAR
jgi:hypothetical protein